MHSSSPWLDRETVEPVSSSHEFLVGMRSSVAADGAGTTFDLAFTNHQPFRVLVPFEGMPAIYTELRQAQMLMLQRQRLQIDKGHARLLELCRTALRPRHLDVLADPFTGDRLFVHQFDEHAPIVFRVTPSELAGNMRLIVDAMARSLH